MAGASGVVTGIHDPALDHPHQGADDADLVPRSR